MRIPIEINGVEHFIMSDAYEFSIVRQTIAQESGKVNVKTLGHFNTLTSLFRFLLEYCLKQDDITSLQELQESIQKHHEFLAEIFDKRIGE